MITSPLDQRTLTSCTLRPRRTQLTLPHPTLAIINYFVLFAVCTLIVQTFVFFVNPCKSKSKLYQLARRRDCHTPKDYRKDTNLGMRAVIKL